MSKYRIHRVTDKDKAFNDLLDEAGYDYEDQAVYCLTDKKGKLYSNGGAAPVYISSYNKDVKGIPSEAMRNLEAQVYFTRVVANKDNIGVKQYTFDELANKDLSKKKVKLDDAYCTSVIDMNEDNRLIWADQSEDVKAAFLQFANFVDTWYDNIYNLMAGVIEEKVNDYLEHQSEYDEDAERFYEDEDEYEDDEEDRDDDEEYDEDEEEELDVDLEY